MYMVSYKQKYGFPQLSGNAVFADIKELSTFIRKNKFWWFSYSTFYYDNSIDDVHDLYEISLLN